MITDVFISVVHIFLIKKKEEILKKNISFIDFLGEWKNYQRLFHYFLIFVSL